MRLAYSSCQPQ